MNGKRSILRDFFQILFSSGRFFEERFIKISSSRAFVMGYLGVFIGLFGGSVIAALMAHAIHKDMGVNQHLYLPAIKSLGMGEAQFLDLVKNQESYSVLMALLSPIIAYIAPHIFAGILFVFLWLFIRPTEKKLDLFPVLNTSAIALTGVFFSFIPIIGSLISAIVVGRNVARGLFIHYQLRGFLLVMSIVFTIYLCLFLISSSIQMLAVPFIPLLP